MPEKGWKTLTVRENTAQKIKESAHSKDLTVDDYLNLLLSLEEELSTKIRRKTVSKSGWIICDACGVKLKAKNLEEHILKVHPFEKL